MANFNKRISDTKVRVGEIRLSYAFLFSKRTNMDGTEGKYSTAVLIPKSNTQAVQLIKDAIEAAKQAGKDKFNGKVPTNLKTPLRDGDEEHPDDAAYEGMYFLNCSSSRKPDLKVLENGHLSDALDEDDVYSGAWGAITLNMFAYNNSGNKGIGCGLGNFVKTRDGERMSGGSTGDEDFGDLAEDDELD